jgi:hypothetical protein
LSAFYERLKNTAVHNAARTIDYTAFVRAKSGRDDVLHELLPLVYKELRRVADKYLRRERSDHTLQPTALVHEAYIRLIGQKAIDWQNRAHFFGVAAHLMREI